MKYLGILAAILFVLMNSGVKNMPEPYRSIVMVMIFLIWFILIGVFSIAAVLSGIYEHKKRKETKRQQQEIEIYKALHIDDINFYEEFVGSIFYSKQLPEVYRGFSFYVVNDRGRELFFYCKNDTYSIRIKSVKVNTGHLYSSYTDRNIMSNLEFMAFIAKDIKRHIEIAKSRIDEFHNESNKEHEEPTR